MKIIRFGLPVIALAAIMSAALDHKLKGHIVASADAGALPESTRIFNQMFTKVRVVQSKTAPKTRLAVRASTVR